MKDHFAVTIGQDAMFSTTAICNTVYHDCRYFYISLRKKKQQRTHTHMQTSLKGIFAKISPSKNLS